MMRRRAGFTLIELLVAIAIAGFTASALYGIFTVQTRQFIVQDIQMEMHQNMRFAADMLSRSARMAGYGTDGELLGELGLGGTGSSLPVVISWDADGANGTDAITLAYADPDLVMDTRNDRIPSYDTTSLYFRPSILDNADKLAQYQQDDLLICFNYASMRGMDSYIWSLSSDPDTTNGVIPVNDASGFSDYANSFTVNKNLAPALMCSKGDVYTFYVDDVDDGVGPGTPDHPVLMLDMDMGWPEDDDVPLVDNIEDLQIEFCEDDGTDSVDCSLSTSWADSMSGTDASNVWMIRISMVARSSREEPSDRYQNLRPTLANHTGASAGSEDGYYREVLVTEVTVRNMRTQATAGAI